MSRESVERAFEALGREDLPAVAQMLDPKAEVHDFDIPDAGVYHGEDAADPALAHRGFRAEVRMYHI